MRTFRKIFAVPFGLLTVVSSAVACICLVLYRLIAGQEG